MTNFTINPGGFIGALLGAGIGGVLLYMESQSTSNATGRGASRGFLLFIVGGAAAGNYVWEFLFKRAPEPKKKMKKRTRTPKPVEDRSGEF